MDVTCPQCSAVYHADRAHVGKHLRCTRCGSVVPILDAARNLVRQEASRPARWVSRAGEAQPPRSSRGRVKSSHTASAVVGALLILGLAGYLTFVIRFDSPRTGTANTSGMGEPPSVQPQLPPAQGSSQPSNAVEIISEEPAPTNDGPAFVDDPRPTQYNSLPTGTRIVDNTDSNGHGELSVENGTRDDAVVCLNEGALDANNAVLWFFVRRHSTAHVDKIPEGTFSLSFTTGLNWIESDEAFSWHPAYFQFQRVFDFSERRDADGIEYHSISVTLQAVPNGNVRTTTISREQFLRGHKHIAMRQDLGVTK